MLFVMGIVLKTHTWMLLAWSSVFVVGYFFCNPRVTLQFFHESDRLVIRTNYPLWPVRIREMPITTLEGAILESSARRGRTTTYRVALLLRGGERFALTPLYNASEANAGRTVSAILIAREGKASDPYSAALL